MRTINSSSLFWNISCMWKMLFRKFKILLSSFNKNEIFKVQISYPPQWKLDGGFRRLEVA